MTQTLRSIMNTEPISVDATEPVTRAAVLMRDHDIGDVLVTDRGRLVGILTDRDIVVRAVAADEASTSIDGTMCGQVCTTSVIRLSPDDTFDDAATVMADNALRRVPVVDGEEIVGIISLGDLAVEADPESVLSEISAAPPHN